MSDKSRTLNTLPAFPPVFPSTSETAEADKRYQQDGCTPETAIVISDRDDTVKLEKILADDSDLDPTRIQTIALILLSIRNNIDSLDVHISKMKSQSLIYESEIAAYKSQIAKLEEAERKRIQSAQCRICYESPNSHFLSCGHAFCHDCIMQWVVVNGKCPTCRQPCYILSKSYSSVIVSDS